jgi:hypothetical protein
MKRREVLAAGGLTGVALGTGCAPALVVPGGFDAASALSDLDRSLAQSHCISSSLGGAPFACAPGVPAERFRDDAARVTRICTEGARAMTVSAFFQSLAPDERLHPAIQARMHAELPRIGGAVASMAEALEQVGPRERKAIQEHLRASPGLEDRIASEVDGYASRSDAPFAKRVQFRRQLEDVAWRMRHQSADVVIDEVLAKFRKGEAYQRAHAEQILALAEPTAQPPPGAEPAAVAPSQQVSDNWWMPGTITSLVGLGTLGLGVIGGQVLVGAASIFGATLAVLLVGVGVIVLLVGLLMLAAGAIGHLSSGGQKGQPPAPAAPSPDSRPSPGTVPL